MSFSQTNAQPIEGPYVENPGFAAQPPQQFELTAEEIRIIRECSREGIYQRALPMGIACGIGGLLGAKAGPLMHSRFGAKPAVIGFGIIGYAIGRMSYSKVCFHRAIQVPDGNLRKMFPNAVKNNELLEPSQNFYSSVDTTTKSQDQSWVNRSLGTDIDLPSMTNLDTPGTSEYYAPRNDYVDENKEAQSYTSYEDLRKQNRQEYINKGYTPESQRSPPRYQQRYQDNSRRPQQDSENFGSGAGPKTKYGDSWE